jgi:hypothetical protein
MNTQKMVLSSAKDSKGQQLLIKKFSQPAPKALEIFHALKLKQAPFRMKKYVLPH